MAEGVVAIDEEEKITSINPALLKKLKWEGESSFWDFMLPNYLLKSRYRKFSPES